MNAPSGRAILREVEDHLARALALLDAHGLGSAAAPHLDLGLHYISEELAEIGATPSGRSAG